MLTSNQWIKCCRTACLCVSVCVVVLACCLTFFLQHLSIKCEAGKDIKSVVQLVVLVWYSMISRYNNLLRVWRGMAVLQISKCLACRCEDLSGDSRWCLELLPCVCVWFRCAQFSALLQSGSANRRDSRLYQRARWPPVEPLGRGSVIKLLEFPFTFTPVRHISCTSPQTCCFYHSSQLPAHNFS